MKCMYRVMGVMILLYTVFAAHYTFAETTLSWDQGDGDVIGYRIYYGQAQGAYTESKDVGNVTSYPLSGLPLSEGATYYLIVRAYNSAGESDDSNEITYLVPDNSPPLQPQGLVANSTELSLSWQPNTEPDLKGYRVYYGMSSGNYYPYLPVGKETTYRFSGLEAGTRYYCAVTAVDLSGNESGFSSAVVLTVPSSVDSSTESTASGPVISWSPSSGTVTGYRVYYGTAPGVYPNSWHAGNTTQVPLSDLPLEEGTTYYFVVRAYNESGESGDSEILTWETSSSAVPDETAPEISIQKPVSGIGGLLFATELSTLDMSGTASDNEGVVAVTWVSSRGGNGQASGVNTWSVSGISLAEGENRITVTAADAEGNKASQVLTVSYSAAEEEAPEDTITSPEGFALTDVTAASGKQYPVRESLADGALCYIDRNYTYGSVPAYLKGAAFIQPANDDKRHTEASFLRFAVNMPARVYVMFDDRFDLPSWLSDFTNTGDNLRTDTAMSVLYRDYPSGTVELPGNGHGGSHYTVAATPIPPAAADMKLSITNLTVASGKRYPVRESLSDGALCYIDRNYTYGSVPAYLKGAAFIQPANDDKRHTDAAFLRFVINMPARVYVMFDDRFDQPSWLSGFTNTGDTLRTDTAMNVLYRDYPSGTVTLPGNGHGGSHYTVAITR